MAKQDLSPKQLYEKNNLPYFYYVLRPLGRILIPICINLKISPNQVTTISTIFSLLGIILLVPGSLVWLLTSFLLLQIALILDMLDGDLAREIGKTTKSGEFLDAMGGYLRGSLLFPLMGIGLASNPDNGYSFLSNIASISTETLPVLGMLAGISHVVGRLISLRFSSLFMKPFRSTTGKITLITLNFEDKMFPIMLVCILTAYLTIPFFIFSVYSIAACIYVVVRSYIQVTSKTNL